MPCTKTNLLVLLRMQNVRDILKVEYSAQEWTKIKSLQDKPTKGFPIHERQGTPPQHLRVAEECLHMNYDNFEKGRIYKTKGYQLKDTILNQKTTQKVDLKIQSTINDLGAKGLSMDDRRGHFKLGERVHEEFDDGIILGTPLIHQPICQGISLSVIVKKLLIFQRVQKQPNLLQHIPNVPIVQDYLSSRIDNKKRVALI